MLRKAATSFLIAASVSIAPVAFGQPAPGGAPPSNSAPTHDDPAKRLFEEGRELAQEGRYAEACPKLEESQKLRPGVGTLYNLADCNAHIGKTATAYRQFLEVADQTAAEGEAERERVARAKAAELEPKLMKVALSVPSSPPSLEIRIDGRVIRRDEVASAIPLDPGTHTIAASAPGEDPFTTEVALTEEGKVVTVAIPVGDGEVPADEPKTYRKTGHLIAGSILTGVGALLLVTGVIALGASGQLEGMQHDNAIAHGAIAIPVGAVMLAPGIPLFISGLKSRPVEPEGGEATFDPPALTIGAAATWSF